MAKILISTNPNLIPSSSLFSSIRPLLDLCKGDQQLLQFEALMALTNIASVSEETKARIVGEPQGLSTLQYLQFSEHELVRRAATEAICNLLPNDKVIEQVFMNEEKVRLWIAFASLEDEAEDFETARAAGGALAMVSQVPQVSWVLMRQGGIKAFTAIIEQGSNFETLHRALFAMQNMLEAISGAAKDEEKTEERTKFIDEVKQHSAILKQKLIAHSGNAQIKDAAQACLGALEQFDRRGGDRRTVDCHDAVDGAVLPEHRAVAIHGRVPEARGRRRHPGAGLLHDEARDRVLERLVEVLQPREHACHQREAGGFVLQGEDERRLDRRAAAATRAQELAAGPPGGLLGAPHRQRRRLAEPHDVARGHPGQGRHGLGGRRVQDVAGLLGGLPEQAAARQVHAAAVPPERVPVGHGLPEHPERGQGLEAQRDHQADPQGRAGPAGPAQHGRPGAARALHGPQERPGAVQAQGASVGAQEPRELRKERNWQERGRNGRAMTRG
ncbi:hypothetical protein ON010_g16873 [Phytophthora cinnamomi]|nr:hypothetical protein ON010_g16873 [Phytophthora cinnamomi]